MRPVLVGIAAIALMANAFGKDWPDGAKEAIAEGCLMDGLKGGNATAEQIKAARVACDCFATQMIAQTSFDDFERAAKTKDGGEKMDLSPAGQKLRIKIEMECGAKFDAVK